MPSRYRIKEYNSDTIYHLFNRGVERRQIFIDEQDYSVYLSYLKTYLIPKDTLSLQNILSNPQSSRKEKDSANKLLRMNNFSESIHMLSFVLMPNHFHQLVWQRDENAIDSYMNSLNTRYTSYFNRKYKRLGPLCQGVYKAVNISSEEQLLYVTAYIHRNPLPLISQGLALRDWKYSSYPNYLRIRNDSWLNAELILNNFPKTGNLTYKKFVEEEYSEKNTDGILTEVCIDDL